MNFKLLKLVKPVQIKYNLLIVKKATVLSFVGQQIRKYSSPGIVNLGNNFDCDLFKIFEYLMKF